MCAAPTSACNDAARAADNDDRSAGCPGVAWARLAEAALAAAASGDWTGASRAWEDAARLAEDAFEPRDPRRAASVGNLGCVALAAGDAACAARRWREACAQWRDAAAWVERMQLASPARSSTFHLRMQMRHRDAWRALALADLRKLPDAGRAVALNNLGVLDDAAGRGQNAREFYAQALAARADTLKLAGADAAAEVMRANLDGAERGAPLAAQLAPAPPPAFGKLAAARRWIIDEPPEMTDTGALFGAALLAATLARAAQAAPLSRT